MNGPEPRQYTAGESAKLAGLVALMAARGRSASLDRAIERVKADACAREVAEDKAREAARLARAERKGQRRAARWGR